MQHIKPLVAALLLAAAALLSGCATAPAGGASAADAAPSMWAGCITTTPDDAAHATALAGHASDIGTTLVGLASGKYGEANPIWPLALVIKPWLICSARAQPEPERTQHLLLVGAIGHMAGFANVATMLGAPWGLNFVIGGIAGWWWVYGRGADEPANPASASTPTTNNNEGGPRP